MYIPMPFFAFALLIITRKRWWDEAPRLQVEAV
jgi:hypothetical protein